MSQDQEIIGAESNPSEAAEALDEEAINALEETKPEMLQEAADESVSETTIDEADAEQALAEMDAGVPESSEKLDDQDSHPMDVLLEEESYDLEMPRRGEIRVGTIARVTETDVLVDVGAKSEGVIPAREIERLDEQQRSELQVGSEVQVYVLRSGARDGNLILSVSRAQEEQDWRDAEELLENKELFEGLITGYNKGGLIVKLGRLRGFVPASQVSLSRRRRASGSTPDQRWGKMVNEPIMTKVIEVDRRRNRLILSERAATREARDALKERLISELKRGEIRSGHVISMADFGVFVDIGGADGLVHLSELSWKRISHPREVVKVGQQVEVKVIGVDRERKRISLSMRELESDPWDEILERYNEGQLIEGTITKLTKFGAFASLSGTEDYDIEGLIHISELSDRRVEHPREVVSEGQVLTLRVIKLDAERKRIGLSLKRVSSAEYAEQDWQAAMQEIEDLDEEGIAVAPADEVEDFDAALEAEGEDIDELEEAPEEEVVSAPEAEADLEAEADVGTTTAPEDEESSTAATVDEIDEEALVAKVESAEVESRDEETAEHDMQEAKDEIEEADDALEPLPDDPGGGEETAQ